MGGDPPGAQRATNAERLGSFLVRVGLAIALGYVALAPYHQAATDWEYQLVGLADPFLGRPAPGWTIGIGAIVSALLGIAWVIGRAVAGRMGLEQGTPGSDMASGSVDRLGIAVGNPPPQLDAVATSV